MTVELFGMARALAGTGSVELALGPTTTRSELVRALADRCPQLVGAVVDDARGDLVEPNLLLLDGRRAPQDGETFGEDDRPCILFLASGG